MHVEAIKVSYKGDTALTLKFYIYYKNCLMTLSCDLHVCSLLIYVGVIIQQLQHLALFETEHNKPQHKLLPDFERGGSRQPNQCQIQCQK